MRCTGDLHLCFCLGKNPVFLCSGLYSEACYNEVDMLFNALGFQHSPRDLGNVYEWKIIFDPFNTLL